MRPVKPLLGPTLVLLSLMACAGAPGTAAPPATWPVFPEPLPAAKSGGADARLTCGGRTFPTSGLDAPTGAEKLSGPEFAALRATIAKFADAFPGSSAWTWRLAGRDDAGAIFLARTDALGSPGWVSIEVTGDTSGWQPLNMGQCDLQVVLSAEFGPASWALDPAFAEPIADTIDLHILVWERSCSSGRPTTGRMSAPLIRYTADTVTMTIGVRPLDGAQSCPMPPGTPASVRLMAPLGNRALLDGGQLPPAPPSPANR
jgi:hypothetical protein